MVLTDYAKYPKRTERKIRTMWKIFQVLPSTFTVIHKNIKNEKGKDYSSRIISQRLGELEDLGFIKKDHNLYRKVPKEKWCKFTHIRDSEMSPYRKFSWSIKLKMKTTFMRRQRGKDPEKILKSIEEEFNNYVEEMRKRES